MDADLGELGRRRRRGSTDAFTPQKLFGNGEQGVWYDPSDLSPEKVSWRRNLLTYSENFENAAWTKSNASILSNLALYSQDFDNAAWTKDNSTVTANSTTAPDGTTTADSLFETTATASHAILQGFSHSASINTTLQVRVKPNGRTRVSLYAGGVGDLYGAVFDLVSSGSVVNDLTSGSGTVTSRSITALADGWYLLTVVGVRGANTSSTIVLALHQGTTTTAAPSYAGDVTKGVLIWGAQFLPGSTAQTYTRSLATAAPVLFSDPLGGTQADKLVENTATAFHQAQQTVATTTGVTQTLTVYAKAAERTQIAMQLGADAAFFNLSNGTIVSGTGATITDVGNGWYRCAKTNIPTNTNVLIFLAVSGSANYLGDGVSGVYLYGAQLETASTASAYQRITDFNSDFLAAFPTHALYQDSIGAAPVTALGQSVGRVLDKRLGGIASATRISTNEDFSNGSTGWSLQAGWSVVGGEAVVNSAVAGTTYLRTSTATIVDATYRVTFTVRSVTGTGVAAVAGTNQTTGVTSPGTYTFFVVANSTAGAGVFGGSTNTVATVDNVIVELVPGNHALQATSASRPTLQARSNLLTYTEQFDNAAWFKQNTTLSSNNASAPDGTTTADLLYPSTTGTFRSAYQSGTTAVLTTAIAKTISVYAKASGLSFIFIGDAFSGANNTWFNVSSGTVGTVASNHTASIESVGNGWYRCSVSFSVAWGASALLGIALADANNSTTATTSGTNGVLLWGAQLEQSSTATTYQRVTTATDYADVGLPRNLTFDGTDDSLATAGNVDFTATDKATAFAGVTKLSDAARGMLFELGNNITNRISFEAPTSAAANYNWSVGGTILVGQTVTTYTAPTTNVLTGIGEISTDTCAIRVNGALAGSNSSDQGTGTYASSQIFVGRRNNATLPFNGRLFQLIITGQLVGAPVPAEQWVAQQTGVTI